MSTLLGTSAQPFRRARLTNATDNGFPTRVPTKTEPTGTGNNAAQATASGVHSLNGSVRGGIGQNSVIIVPYGVGSDTNTFVMRVLGWRILSDQSDAALLEWIPVKLAEFTCTLTSGATGATGGVLGATNLFVDTIALVGTSGNDDISIDIVSPADNTVGHVVVDLKGSQKLEIVFTTGGSSTSCNALIAMY